MLLPLIAVAAQPAIDGLPNPTVAGYTLAPQDQTIRTDMDVGPPRVRRRSSAGYDAISLAWRFNSNEMQAFREWFDNEVQGGAAWVMVPVADGYGSVTRREARFVGPFSASLSPGLVWDVTAKVEIR